MKKAKLKTIQTKEPDIAFWFDEEDVTRYLVRVKDSIEHVQLIQAAFDLLAKAIRSDEDTVIGNFEIEDDE